MTVLLDESDKVIRCELVVERVEILGQGMIGGERGDVQVGGCRVIKFNSLHIDVENRALVVSLKEEVNGKSDRRVSYAVIGECVVLKYIFASP